MSLKKPKYICKIPEGIPTFEETSKQMRINVDILKKEFTDHVDKEIKRFREKTGIKG